MMTHFLYRSQENAPSEFLKGSRGFRKRVDYDAAEASHCWTDRHLHKIAVTAYLASADELKPSECFTS